MPQSFAERLGWFTKSKNLLMTLERARGAAKNYSHRIVTLEHLLYALLDDQEAGAVLQACQIDIARLKANLDNFIATQLGQLVTTEDVKLEPTEGLQKVLAHASAAAEQSGRAHIDGAIVLAALIGEGTSLASQILKRHGLTFEVAISNLRGGRGAQAQQQGMRANHPTSAPPPQQKYQQTYPVAQSNPGTVVASPTSAPAIRSAPAEQVHIKGGDKEAMVDEILSSVREIIGFKKGEGVEADRIAATTNNVSINHSAIAPNSGSGRPSNTALPHMKPPPVRSRQSPTRPASQLPLPVSNSQAPYPSGGGQGNATSHRPPSPMSNRIPGSVIDAGQLVENIPRKMWIGKPATVAVKLIRANEEDSEQGGGNTRGLHPQARLTEAMTVEVRAPKGGFVIESASPETQWIDNQLEPLGDDYASWSWTITPKARGKQTLNLVISARTIGVQGVIAESALPEQKIDVKVQINFMDVLMRVIGWGMVAIIGGLLIKYGESIYRYVQKII